MLVRCPHLILNHKMPVLYLLFYLHIFHSLLLPFCIYASFFSFILFYQIGIFLLKRLNI
ncbi:hypothetical protein BDF14DRAFT_1845796, partial [Spinellus fusiger]